MRSPDKSLALAAGLCLAALTIGAQSYLLDWSTMDGGGGASSGGAYSVTGTIGQPDAGGVMQGGKYALEGGFWSVIAAIQDDPNAPLLTITCPAPGAIVVSWPASASGWVLEQTNALPAAPGPWPAVPPPYQTNAETIAVSLPNTPPVGHHFFRLHRP